MCTMFTIWCHIAWLWYNSVLHTLPFVIPEYTWNVKTKYSFIKPMQQILAFLPSFAIHWWRLMNSSVPRGADNKVYLSWPPDGTVCAAVCHGIAHVNYMGNKWGQQRCKIVSIFICIWLYLILIYYIDMIYYIWSCDLCHFAQWVV